MNAYIPTVAALESDDDGRLGAELRLRRLSLQVDSVRTVTDHVHYALECAEGDGLSEPLREEMVRLATLLLEAAADRTTYEPPAGSGVFRRVLRDQDGDAAVGRHSPPDPLHERA